MHRGSVSHPQIIRKNSGLLPLYLWSGEPFSVFFADHPDHLPAGLCGGGEAAARLDPLAGHEEAFQSRKGFRHTFAEHHLNGLLRDQPAFDRPFPVTRVPLGGEWSSDIDGFDVFFKSAEPLVEDLYNRINYLFLFILVCVPVECELLPVLKVGLEPDEYNGFSFRSHSGIVTVMVIPHAVSLLTGHL
jgi:hypothetical protein